MTGIYLDHAATTPMLPVVRDVMLDHMTGGFGNASSLHGFGRRAKAAVEDARAAIAQAIGCAPREIVFTSGGTESDNLALFGAAALAQDKRHIVTTAIEHHAVLHSCEQLERQGFEVSYVPVHKTGQLHWDALERAIRPDTLLISVMYGNNEVGTLQPISRIAELARQRNILFHVDAVQALGYCEIDLSKLPVDLMSFSAHKLGGPQGVGALYCSSRVKLGARLFGGSQERKRRAGTENVAGIAGFAAAVSHSLQFREQRQQNARQLRQMMQDELARSLPEQAFVVNGHPDDAMRLPHILNVSFPGVSTETMLMRLDLEGIAAASGSACSSGALETSHVLLAMGLEPEVAGSAIRFSFGDGNTEREIIAAARTVATIFKSLRNKS